MGCNKAHVPNLENIKQWSDERIFTRYRNTDMFIGGLDSIQYIEEAINRYIKTISYEIRF